MTGLHCDRNKARHELNVRDSAKPAASLANRDSFRGRGSRRGEEVERFLILDRACRADILGQREQQLQVRLHLGRRRALVALDRCFLRKLGDADVAEHALPVAATHRLLRIELGNDCAVQSQSGA